MKKSRESDKRDGWYFIDPLTATRLLDEQPENRPLRESKSLKFAAEITAKRWLPNGEPIILDEHGQLLDGQGRCRAITIAGKPIESYIIHGIPRRYFHSVDIGQQRTGADTLALAGATNYAISSALCRLSVLAEEGNLGTNIVVSNERINAYWKKNADRIAPAISDLGKYINRSPIPASLFAYVYMVAKDIDANKAKLFANGLATGEGLSSGSPLLVLRNRMISIKGEAHKLKQNEKLALTIKAWNAFYQDRSVGLLKWVKRKAGGNDKNNEAFPSFLTKYMVEL